MPLVILALLVPIVLRRAARADLIIDKPQFSIALPDGWVEIPKPALDRLHRELQAQAPAVEAPRYDYGFQADDDGEGITYPYLLVQLRSTGRIPQREFRSLPQLDLNQAPATDAAHFGPLLKEASIGPLQFDPAGRVLWQQSRSDVVGVGPVRGLTGMIPTQQGLIAIHAYARESDFPDWAPRFQELVRTVQVSPDLAYRWDAPDPWGWRIDWRQLGINAVIGVLVGVAYGLYVAYVREPGNRKT